MRILDPSSLPRYVKRFRYLVYGRYVYNSVVLTLLHPGQLAETPDGQPLWIVTKGDQSIPWEFHHRATAIEIQRHEMYAHDVTEYLASQHVDQPIRNEVRDLILKILIFHADDLTAPALSPQLSQDYPLTSSLA